jgi:Fe-Mn family superoxide dismutase
MTGFALPTLPYALDALAPQISRETMEYHYGKHLQAYITNLNNLVKGTPFEEASLEEIVLKSDGPIFNNAAQAWNHEFFFLSLSPIPKSVPTGKLADAIDREFGSFQNFKDAFSKAAAGQFGSGWAWLVKDKTGKLSIVATSNAGNPMKDGLTPLLTLDVWEHAYYIDYRNRRPDFIAASWERVDWKVVEERFAK